MLTKVLRYHSVISLLFMAATVALGTLHQLSSVALGCALMALNLGALVWTWQRIFLKKSIALAVSVIVFKYAILGVIIYLFVGRGLVHALGFIAGLSSVIPTIGWIALQENNFLKSEVRSVDK